MLVQVVCVSFELISCSMLWVSFRCSSSYLVLLQQGGLCLGTAVDLLRIEKACAFAEHWVVVLFMVQLKWRPIL